MTAISGMLPTMLMHSRQIVGERTYRHLGGHFRQRLRQEVRCAHAPLHRAEEMLSRFAALAHGLRVRI